MENNNQNAESQTRPAPSITSPDHQQAEHTGRIDNGYVAKDALDDPNETKQSATQMVWQWLCYSLWGWTLAALGTLLSSTLVYYVKDDSDHQEFIVYTLAVLICLLPLAFVAEKIYAKRELAEKHGFSAVIMVISAVVVFLATIAGLITGVVTGLSILVDPTNNDTKFITMGSAIMVAILGTMLFARILNPPRLHRFQRIFPYIVLVIVGVALVFAIGGPFRSQIAGRSDKLIENNLNSINYAINDYANQNDALPGSLQDLVFEGSFQNDARLLIEQNLVEYRMLPGDQNDTNQSFSRFSVAQTSRKLSYELCVDYKRKKGNPRNNSNIESSSYIYTDAHEAGRVCYKKIANVYKSSPNPF